MSSIDLSEKTILVTGATDGLGRALAGELAAAGATVLIHGRDPERLAQAEAEVATRGGADRVRSYRADFSSLADVGAMADQILACESRLDVLINNAGIGTDVPGGGQRRGRSADRDAGLDGVFDQRPPARCDTGRVMATSLARFRPAPAPAGRAHPRWPVRRAVRGCAQGCVSAGVSRARRDCPAPQRLTPWPRSGSAGSQGRASAGWRLGRGRPRGAVPRRSDTGPGRASAWPPGLRA